MRGKNNIFITGMHQTGVDDVARFLTKQGGQLPESGVEQITTLNNDILKDLNCYWDQLDINTLALSRYFQTASQNIESINAVLDTREGVGLLLPDPLFCLTANFWAQTTREPLYVVCIRNPVDIAYDLKHHYGFSLYKGLSLWECYYWNLLRIVEENNCIFFSVERFSDDEKSVQQEFVDNLSSHGITLDRLIDEKEIFISLKSIRANRASEEELKKLLSFEQMSLWVDLQNRAGSVSKTEKRRLRAGGKSALLPLIKQSLRLFRKPKQLWSLSRDFKLIQQSEAYFDRQFYLQRNPDIVQSGEDPLLHFLTKGWREARNPSPFFDLQFYLENNPDIKRAGINPLVHYIREGWKEGRLPNNRLDIATIFALKQATIDAHSNTLDLFRAEGVYPQSQSEMPRRLNRIQCEKKLVRNVAIIIPVYLSTEESVRVFKLLISSLLRSYPAENELLKFIFIDDASPLAKMQLCLKESNFTARKDVQIYQNDQNLGFVKTVNSGFRLVAETSDVVILNSDTEIHGAVFEILQTNCLRYPKIASVTPLSNRAGLNCICFWPIGEDAVYELEPSQVAFSIEEFGLESPNDYLPTGHGFCMYMSQEAMQTVGLFDEERFAMGYGEENDWSLRAVQQGFRHLASTECYVHHHESRSFSSDQKKSSQEKNRKILSSMYPFYDGWVQNYLNRNPLELHRKILQINLLEEEKKQQGRQTICFVLHDSFKNPFGGVQQYTRQLIEELEAHSDAEIFVIAPTELNGEYYELYYQQGYRKIVIEKLDDRSLIKILRCFERRIDFLHLHNTFGLVTGLIEWINSLQHAKKIYSLHDYQLFCKNPFLLDSSGKFCLGAQNRTCFEECSAISQNGTRFLHHFDLVIVPSEDCKRNTRKLLGDSSKDIRIEVLPHFLSYLNQREIAHSVFPQRVTSSNVVFLGALFTHKGGELFLDSLPDIIEMGAFPVIWGKAQKELVDQYENIPAIYGYHNHQTLCELYTKLGAEVIVMPTICAETFSYTLYEALFLLETPVVVGAYGHPADIVKQYGVGCIVENNSTSGLITGIKDALENREKYVENIKIFKKQVYKQHLPDRYLQHYASLIGLYCDEKKRDKSEVLSLPLPEKKSSLVSHLYSQTVGREDDALKVLMIHGLSSGNPPYFYRYENPATFLVRSGCAITQSSADDINLTQVEQADIVYLSRTPMSEGLAEMFKLTKRLNITTVLDVDDLIFHSSFLDQFYFLEKDKEHRQEYGDLLSRMEQTFQAADYLLGSTPEIAEAGMELGKPSLYFRNVLLQRHQHVFAKLYRNRPVFKEKIIGYFSGSNTHDRDFDSICDVLEEVFACYSDARLLIMGFVSESPFFRRHEQRIIRLPFGDYADYLRALQRCKVVMTPLAENNRFSNAKSNIKFIEAGAVGTPVISSPVREMVSSIEHGVTGWLASDKNQWLNSFHQALFEDFSEYIGKQANRVINQAFKEENGEFYRLLCAMHFNKQDK